MRSRPVIVIAAEPLLCAFWGTVAALEVVDFDDSLVCVVFVPEVPARRSESISSSNFGVVLV